MRKDTQRKKHVICQPRSLFTAAEQLQAGVISLERVHAHSQTTTYTYDVIPGDGVWFFFYKIGHQHVTAHHILFNIDCFPVLYPSNEKQ